MRPGAVGALAVIAFGVAGLAWTALELVPQTLGFEDTDDPAVSLAYLAAHADVYRQAGLALAAMSLTQAIGAFALWDALVGRAPSLGLRFVTLLGLFSSASFFLFGVMRFSVGPLLYIDGLDHGWGQAAYLVTQVAGVHGFAQAGIVLLGSWAIGLAILGVLGNVLPRWLALLAIVPAIRVASILGPLGVLPEGTWILFMLAIPGTMVWFVLLGLVLLARARRSSASPTAVPAA